MDQKTTMEIIAHRGASYDAPENTLPAIQLAWEQNADAVEIDVHVSSDDQIVVIHDPDTRRTANTTREIIDSPLADLQTLDVGTWKDPRWSGAIIPTLEQVLAIIPSGKRLFVELKFPPSRTQAFIRTCGGFDPKQLVLIGFSLEIMSEVKAALPNLEAALVAELNKDPAHPVWHPSITELIDQATSSNLNALDLNAAAPLTAAVVDQIHAARLKCYVWTCDSPPRARQLALAGIDGITTNRPGWLRQHLTDPLTSHPASRSRRKSRNKSSPIPPEA